jgi:hypothetical protein
MIWRKGDERLVSSIVSVSCSWVEKRRVVVRDGDDVVDAIRGTKEKARDARAAIVRYIAIFRFIVVLCVLC